MEHGMDNGSMDRNDDNQGKTFGDMPVPVGINRVFLLGSVFREPTVRYFDPERMVANITLATKKTWKDRGTGKWKEGLEFHRAVCYDGLAAEAKGLGKGDIVCIEGAMRTMKFQDKVTGADRYMTEVVVNKLTFIGNMNFSDGGSTNVGSISIPLRNIESGEDAVVSTIEEWGEVVRRKGQSGQGFTSNHETSKPVDYNPSKYNPPQRNSPQGSGKSPIQNQNAPRGQQRYRDNSQEEFGGYGNAYEPSNGTDGIPF